MSTAASLAVGPEAGWLRSTRFDLNFIFGATVLALVSGAIVVAEPRLFAPILILDGVIWQSRRRQVEAAGQARARAG